MTSPIDITLSSIRSLLKHWLPEASWPEAELRRAERLIRRLGGAIGALDERAAQPFLPAALDYQLRLIKEAVEAAVCHLTNVPQAPWPGFAPLKHRARGSLEGLAPSTMIPLLNVNTASKDALATLPGIGATTARRLMARRRSDGFFRDLEQVRTAGVLNRNAFERAAPYLTAHAPSPPRATPRVLEAIGEGGMTALVEAVRDGRLAVPFTIAIEPEQILLDTLDRAVHHIVANAYRPWFWIPSETRLRQGDRAQARTRRLTEAGRHAARLAPVPSGAYLPLL